MSYEDGLERGGACNECGEPVEEEWHAYCSSCFAEQQGWRPRRGDEERPASLRLELERLRAAVEQLRARLARLERGRAA
jgi:hypothetical protein